MHISAGRQELHSGKGLPAVGICAHEEAYLGGVDDASLHEVFVLAGGSVEADILVT